MAANHLQDYRKRPGLDPRQALVWHSIRVSICLESESYAAIASAQAQLLNADCSYWIGNARIPGEGWHPATQQCQHQEQLLKTAHINQYNSANGDLHFFCDVQARFIPLLAKFLHRQVMRACNGTGDRPVSIKVSFLAFDYPKHLWEEMVGKPEPLPQPEPIEPAEWGAK